MHGTESGVMDWENRQREAGWKCWYCCVNGGLRMLHVFSWEVKYRSPASDVRISELR